MTASRGLVLAAGLALALTTGACSSGSTSTATAPAASTAAPSTPAAPATTPSKDVVAAMRTAVNAATSVAMSGYVVQKGDRLELNLSGTRDGSNTKAAVKTAQGTFDLLSVDGATYMKADAQFWTAQGQQQAGTLLAGKWVKLPEAMKQSMKSFTVGGLLDSMIGSIKEGETAASSTRATRDGKDVYVVTSTKGEGELLVDATTKLPVKFAGTTEQGELSFTDWNTAAKASAPPTDQVFDMSKLGG